MKRYQSHKVVEAAKVMAAERQSNDTWVMACDDGMTYAIHSSARPTEDDLGYVVRYADGYTSWSPSKAFEDGYTEIPA